MIAKDQPTIFDSNVTIAVSSVADGNMKFGVNEGEDVAANREEFLEKVGVSLDQTTPISLTYDRDDYATYYEVADEDKGRNMHRPEDMPAVDALVTTRPNRALFLGVADCCPVVLYDQAKHILMLSHIGRHSAEVDGGRRSVEHLQQNYGSSPSDLKVWLGPAVGKATYPIVKKGGRGLHELILEQLAEVGVPSGNVEVCKIDTATDPNYFSHSLFKAGKQTGGDGRFAVVAMMSEQGEPAF
jgi:copper oxidase (laccase) domain-containing protein